MSRTKTREVADEKVDDGGEGCEILDRYGLMFTKWTIFSGPPEGKDSQRGITSKKDFKRYVGEGV